jgi:hypothetical protein
VGSWLLEFWMELGVKTRQKPAICWVPGNIHTSCAAANAAKRPFFQPNDLGILTTRHSVRHPDPEMHLLGTGRGSTPSFTRTCSIPLLSPSQAAR